MSGYRTYFGWIGGILALAALYFAAAKLGLSLALAAQQVSPVWPPTGIALAYVLLFGYRMWPGIAVGAFLANITANEPWPTAFGIAVGNTLEALVAGWLLRSLVGFRNSLDRLRDVIGLIVLAVGVGAAVSATIGVMSLSLGGIQLPAMRRAIQWGDFGWLWWVWWLGDAIGAIVVAPVILVWVTNRPPLTRPGDLPLASWPARRLAEGAALLAGLVITSWITFASGLATGVAAASLAYALFPFVIWAALLFGQQGTTTVTLVASSIAIWATVHHLGPFGAGAVHERLLLLQVFLGVTAVTGLLLSAALAERRQAEQALKEQDRRKDEFLALLAHELRNPLAPIASAVQLMHIAGPHNPDVENAKDVIDRQVKQMSRLVDDLLDVSRVTRGKIDLHMDRLDLATVVNSAVESSRPLVEAQRHKLSVTLPPEPIHLQGDMTRLSQVFSNLLNNAAKYTPPGGEIWLTAQCEGHEAVVRVRDNGIGIPAEHLSSVFEMFRQVDRSLERAAGGLGIGLTLVRRLIEMHGGQVEAHSEGLGRGSEFVVRLPMLPPPIESRQVRPSSAAEPVSLAGSRILIVDDNKDAAHTLAKILRIMGGQVQTAYDGVEGIDAAAALRPNIVLLDIGLPKLNGYEVCRRLREQPLGKDLIIIALTGWGQDEDRRKSKEAGFDHHLVKPVDYAALEKLLASVQMAAV